MSNTYKVEVICAATGEVLKTLEAAFAPAQPAAEASRFGSPELQAMIIARCVEKDQAERVYAFRRKGLEDFCTCDEARYEELSNKPHLFETRIFYTAPQPSTTAQAAESVPAVEREQERIAFKDAHRHLGLDEVPDAWGRPMFKHSHVEASWLGWIARASHGQAPAPAQPDKPIACSYGDNGYACCEGGPCQADVHNDKLAEQQAPATAQAADSAPAPPPPPECETEAEKRAFAFGWFKALESERMKADNKKKGPL